MPGITDSLNIKELDKVVEGDVERWDGSQRSKTNREGSSWRWAAEPSRVLWAAGEAECLWYEIAVACCSFQCDGNFSRTPVLSPEGGDRDHSQELGLGIGLARTWLLASPLDLFERHFLISKMGWRTLSALISKRQWSLHSHCSIIHKTQGVKQPKHPSTDEWVKMWDYIWFIWNVIAYYLLNI